jgi:general secretion pathway protein A
MYERFFGLRERPFDLVPNPRFLFLTARKREALANLRHGIGSPRGLTLLLGEAGTGKTTLIQALLSESGTRAAECVLLSNPTLTRSEFYEFLAEAFKLAEGAGSSKARFLFEFRRHLLDRHADGRLSALVLDEAQSMPSELLEEVRLLSNIETTTVKLLNVVLAGQPELAARLNEPSLRQLKQRIALRCELAPFDSHETASYIAGRLRIAGGDPATIFTREAVLGIHDVSGGVPRTINVVCDNAMITGFAAQVKPITRALVDEVRRDFDLQAPSSRDEDPNIAHVQSTDSSEVPSAKTTTTPDSLEPESHKIATIFAPSGKRRRFAFF